ncbi:MarR family winged helix-turn-helix transcriptional regulator [Actinoallomurus iriomotensis]|uniref:MarR family transcriptional regulator n=1 Tax=Actinoallomurus iriomotensis TaxID=478107 RepID=A0A9W6S6M1_9ACTN|nr:MarR family transcriptional regulator [Actinoallomurus iriomotensis]GLY88141.1 MarR family transcriptional regulator [Actinoallomurus iriomotensis]
MRHDESTPARLRGLPSRLLFLAATQAQRIVGDGLARAGARQYHYALLSALEEFGPASQAALSDRTGIYRSDVVAALNELTRRGFVERAPDPDDRRRNVITMTEPGRRQLHGLDALLAQAQDDLLEPLSGSERRELARLLDRLVGHHARRHDSRT